MGRIYLWFFFHPSPEEWPTHFGPSFIRLNADLWLPQYLICHRLGASLVLFYQELHNNRCLVRSRYSFWGHLCFEGTISFQPKKARLGGAQCRVKADSEPLLGCRSSGSQKESKEEQWSDNGDGRGQRWQRGATTSAVMHQVLLSKGLQEPQFEDDAWAVVPQRIVIGYMLWRCESVPEWLFKSEWIDLSLHSL